MEWALLMVLKSNIARLVEPAADSPPALRVQDFGLRIIYIIA